jgi:hypothetical protein
MNTPPPLILINTWLHVYYSNTKQLNYAQQNARRQLEKVFGSAEIAQVYYDYQISLLKK